ncbi:MAG: PilN domain-containing protein [Phycisphaerales bacterium]|jgi:Tfp pilus assembly protein PilN|nr:PilN domain-containing protein [Phycisphaerales bacterium]
MNVSPNQLSFLPDDYLERKARRRTNVICASLFVVVSLALGGAFTLDQRANRQIQSREDQVNQRYAEAAKRIVQVEQMQEKQRQLARQAELSASLLEKVPRSFILAQITNSLPGGVSLLEFKLESKVRATPPPPTKTAFEQRKAEMDAQKKAASPPPPEPKRYDVTMKLTGVAQTDVQVAQYINKLSQSTLLRDVNLLVSDQYTQGDDKLRRFELEMTLRPDAEATVDLNRQNRTAAVDVEARP